MSAFLVSRRLRIALVVAVAIVAIASALGGSAVSNARADTYYAPRCVQHPVLCVEVNQPVSYDGYTYVSGHDEPSLLFYSNQQGSGNSNLYYVTLPTDPAMPPKQNGTGPTWDFQLRPAFWFGMAMCDDQSAPDPGKACPPDTDANIYASTNPKSPRYMGLTPGTAFMEMQFYPPGWGGVGTGVACGPDNYQWCAALNIDSFSSNSNTGQANNDDCLNDAGEEYVNYAIITKSGHSQGPADPLDQTLKTFETTPDTLEMNSGDHLLLYMHDTPAGFQVLIYDLTTGQSGSMTASVANGFGHPLFQPNAKKCTDQPYAFHPMYGTSSPDTRVLWAAHSYNVAASDEIGHFEYCNALSDGQGSPCEGGGATDPSGPDFDDVPCFDLPVVSPSDTVLTNALTGCLGADEDFDGPSYRNGTWPGSPGATASNTSAPFRFTSPLFNPPTTGAFLNYQSSAFETDLPRIEGSDVSPNNDCQRHVYNPTDPSPGSGCVDPPVGAQFYPFYSTANTSQGCEWQIGGASIPGTTNNFGGSAAAEYDGLLESIYPEAGFTTSGIYETFHRTLSYNPCPSRYAFP